MSVTPKAANRTRSAKPAPSIKVRGERLRGALTLAKERGLLAGPKTFVLRGRMSPELVAEAKKSSGITSDSRLLEAALANIAVQDNYWEWLNSRRGSIDPGIDLEF
jgi:hypothetical protein